MGVEVVVGEALGEALALIPSMLQELSKSIQPVSRLKIRVADRLLKSF